jgi:hypothetical protein
MRVTHVESIVVSLQGSRWEACTLSLPTWWNMKEKAGQCPTSGRVPIALVRSWLILPTAQPCCTLCCTLIWAAFSSTFSCPHSLCMVKHYFIGKAKSHEGKIKESLSHHLLKKLA